MFLTAGVATVLLVQASAALGGGALAAGGFAERVAGGPTWFARLARAGAQVSDMTLLGLVLALPVALDMLEDLWIGEPMVADRMWILISVAGAAVLLYQACRAWRTRTR
jgi:hypothetical protein